MLVMTVISPEKNLCCLLGCFVWAGWVVMSCSKTCPSSRSLLTTSSMLTCTLGTSWSKAQPTSAPAARSRQPLWTCVTRLWSKCSPPSGSFAWCCWMRALWRSCRALTCRTSGRFSQLWSRARWGLSWGWKLWWPKWVVFSLFPLTILPKRGKETC